MKISFVACFLGSTAVRASADTGLRASSPAKSKPVKPAADLKAYWSERAAEATFMQVAISEEFTHGQCITGCDNPDFDGNRARCRRDCDKMEENGSTSNTRTATCFSCDDGFKYGSRKYSRCMDACETKRDTLDGICDDATNTDDCYAWCMGASAALDFCLREFDRDGRNFNSDYDNGNNRCVEARSCKQCTKFCTGSGFDDCEEFNCSGEELAQM